MSDQQNDETTYEYKVTATVPFAGANHAKHPEEPHRCRCRCSNTLDPWCPEHGKQVPKLRRMIRTTRGEWEEVPR